ncbi:MAG: UvrD-helicase domain-containing protein, partial [Deltaproteobacteria bacterium]
MKHLKMSDISASGLTLIEASAGTGKTWAIAALYILLLLEERIRPENILVVTYTKAATAELRDRIRKRIADTLDFFAQGRPPADEMEEMLVSRRKTDNGTAIKLLTLALYSFDSAAIYTSHGFCQRALIENAFESGSLFDTEMTSDQSSIIGQACNDFWRTRIMKDQGAFLEYLIANGYTPEKLAAPFEGHFQNPDLQIIPEEIEEPDLLELIRQRDSFLPQVASIWRSEREVIIGEIIKSGLNLTSYKPERIEFAAFSLDKALSKGNDWNGCDGLSLFTTEKIAKSMKKGSTMPGHPFFSICQKLQDAADLVERGYKNKLILCQKDLFKWLKDELAKRKNALNMHGYDDLLLNLHLALEGRGGNHLAAALRERYKAVLIDEFQDTDPLQWKIFARIAGVQTKAADNAGQGSSAEINNEQREFPLFLIGDPKQAIY